jgi:tRNA U34 5-methylaminomethyl-2-thiouridine-forming methyltransferase MnmC
MTEPSTQDLAWEDGVPVSTRFYDPYYSRENELAETRHVFLGGCDLPARWRERATFSIAELGFGTGLNFCATLAEWKATAPPDARLSYTSFELYPLTAQEIDRALAVWPEIDAERAALVAAWKGAGSVEIGSATLTVIAGDARETVPAWPGRADAWYLDGFAPSRNPQMWEPPLLEAVARASAPHAYAATYSVAGAVRRGLESAGFTLERLPGYGRKREMLRSVKTPPTPA